MTPTITERFLPLQCYASRRSGYQPQLLEASGIVLHYFSGRYAFADDPYNPDLCWKLFRDLNFEPQERLFNLYSGQRVPASAHFFIARDGAIVQMVPEKFTSWHAGRSEFMGRRDCNDFMFGVELAGMDGDPYTDEQYQSAAWLSKDLSHRHQFSDLRITGHDHVALPKGRKKDPGPLFDWIRFYNDLRKAA